MTSIDLRVQFKMDTGEYPVWVEDLNFAKELEGWSDLAKPDPATFYGVKFKTIYGIWIEEKLGNPEDLRNEFLRCTSDSAVTFRSRNKMTDILRSDYTLWLEERYINKR